jgi:predicted RNA binding protein YcfA (HicA-like mRNA interferase family)
MTGTPPHPLTVSTVYGTNKIMAGITKLIAKMKNQPNGISPQEADKVLLAHGYTMLRQRGSHRSYRNDTGEMIVIVVENPMKAVYVKNILQRINQ